MEQSLEESSVSILNQNRVKRYYIPPGVFEFDSVVERATVKLSATQQPAREEAHILFPDTEVPKVLDSW